MSNTKKPLCRYILAALAALPAYGSAAQMANMPFLLNNQTVTSGSSSIKPNIMLLLDDSGSMSDPPNQNEYTSKLAITQAAIAQVLEQHQDKVNWSLQTLNNNGGTDLNGYTSDWQDMRRRILGMRAYEGTPTTRRFYEVSQFIRNQTEYRCQKNYILLMSDGDANLSCYNTSMSPSSNEFYWNGSRYPALANLNDSYFGSQNHGSCIPASSGSYDSFWDQNTGLSFFSHTLATKDFKTSGNDKANKSWNGDSADPKDANGNSKFASQTAQTFTISFGDSISERGRTYLRNGASQPNQYFNISNSSDLNTAINSIFDNISDSSNYAGGESYGVTSPTVTSSNIPNMAAVVHLDSSNWSSQLRFFDINANGTLQSTNFKQPSFNNRKTLINTGSGVYYAEALANVDNTYFNTISDNPADQLEWKNALIPWTTRQGDDSSIQNLANTNRYSQAYRVRPSGSKDLGDIIDGSVAAIGDRTRGNRQEFLLAAANDGMVHLFRSAEASNAANPYDLQLSYMPAAMERDENNGGATLAKTLKELAHPEYGRNSNHPHRYMMNGGFTVLRTSPNEDGQRQTFMFGNMGQGGRGAYALNVGGFNRANGNPIALNNNQTTWPTEVPLFETPKGENNRLGYTIGSPKIGRISINRTSESSVDITQNIRYAGFLSSGYLTKPATNATSDSANETALYIYDMLAQEAATGAPISNTEPGRLIRKITVANGIGGLSTPTLLDTNFDGVYDLAYAGDYGGNMYRFDLRGKPQEWTATRIYQGNGTQPITSAPAISRRANGVYIIIFGTGSEIYNEDLTNTDMQAVYGIYDDTNASGSAATSGQLLEQTFTLRNGHYYLSNHIFDANQHRGWKVNLNYGSGEHVVVQPTMILRTAQITSRLYTQTQTESNAGSDPCIASTYTQQISAESRNLLFNSTNGGGLTNNDARLVYQNNPQWIDTETNITYYPNGTVYQGILATTLVDAGSQNDNPMTADGAGGGSGSDGDMTITPTGQKNNCFRNGNSPYLQKNQSGTDLTLDSQQITGPACRSLVQRISWREIF